MTGLCPQPTGALQGGLLTTHSARRSLSAHPPRLDGTSIRGPTGTYPDDQPPTPLAGRDPKPIQPRGKWVQGSPGLSLRGKTLSPKETTSTAPRCCTSPQKPPEHSGHLLVPGTVLRALTSGSLRIQQHPYDAAGAVLCPLYRWGN